MFLSGILTLRQRVALSAIFVVVAAILAYTGHIDSIASALTGLGAAGAFITGIFYTLGMTTPFAMAIIVDLMILGDPLIIALSASLSAALMDVFLFEIVKDSLESHTKRLVSFLHRHFRPITSVLPAFGFFIFGLPLPDELGLALMGITEIKAMRLLIVVFVAKFTTLVSLWWLLRP